MKALLKIIVLFLSVNILFSSCATYTPKDSGKHKGWYKNTNNPHNPNTTNPGHTKSDSKNKSK